MEIENTFLSGLKLIRLKEFKDQRGSFVKILNYDFFDKNGLETDFKESYYSISKKNVIRGMHFQIPPAEHTKLIYLNQGNILDVVLDIRKNSPTYGQFFSMRITENDPLLVYIPVGFAHGFFSYEDNTIVTYLQTSVYHEEYDKGIKYNSFGMNWPTSEPIISSRDFGFDNFVNIKTEF